MDCICQQISWTQARLVSLKDGIFKRLVVRTVVARNTKINKIIFQRSWSPSVMLYLIAVNSRFMSTLTVPLAAGYIDPSIIILRTMQLLQDRSAGSRIPWNTNTQLHNMMTMHKLEPLDITTTSEAHENHVHNRWKKSTKVCKRGRLTYLRGGITRTLALSTLHNISECSGGIVHIA